MPDVPPDELRRMAAAIDESMEPHVRLDATLSAEAAAKVADLLETVAAQTTVEQGWPMLRVAALLRDAAAPPA